MTQSMIWYTLIFISSMLLFAVSCRGLTLSMTENIRIESLTGEYSYKALKLAKSYKVFAWAVLTIVFFFWLAESFWVIFFTI